jgi:teichuronic acid biosynthesis glycosyltransferase TuaC
MNILFVSNLFPSSVQPTRGIYNFYLLKALRSKGCLIEVINPLAYCPGIDSLIRGIKLPPAHEKFNELPVAHPTFFYTPRFFIEKHYWFYRLAITKSMEAGIERLKKRSSNPTDAIHLMLGFIYPDAFALAPICQKLKLDYSVRVNGSDFRLRINQPKFRSHIIKCLHEAPNIFCPGYRLKEDMVKEGIDEAKIHPFNNGVDTSVFYFSQNKASADVQNLPNAQEKSILFAGNLVDVKRIDRLLRAFALLIRNQPAPKGSTPRIRFSLDIVGDGPLLNQLKTLAQTLGIEQQVRFPGRELPQQIASRMQDAACLCLCSASEGMPNVVVEALACGCPVAATDVGEVPYLIKDGLNGYSVSTYRQSETEIIEHLSVALNKVIFQKWNRKNISDKMQNYTWPAAAEVVEAALIK